MSPALVVVYDKGAVSPLDIIHKVSRIGRKSGFRERARLTRKHLSGNEQSRSCQPAH
jgi:hypothetical protein